MEFNKRLHGNRILLRLWRYISHIILTYLLSYLFTYLLTQYSQKQPHLFQFFTFPLTEIGRYLQPPDTFPGL